MANANAGPKTVKKPYFNTYPLASTPEGVFNAAMLRINCEAEREMVIQRRWIKTKRKLDFDGLMENGTITKKPVKVRAGYPVNRQGRPTWKPSQRHSPFSKFLGRFKVVGDKVMALHATRGWKVYA